MWMCLAFIPEHYVCLVPRKIGRGSWIPKRWGKRWL